MNHLLLPLFFALLSCFPDIFTSAAVPTNACPPSTLSVRLPPYLNPALNGSNTSSHYSTSPSYLAPPLSFYTGTWYLTNNSFAAYRNFSNLQWDVRPVLPSCTANTTRACAPGTLEGSLTELTTWALDPRNPATRTNHYNFGALGGGRRPVASILGHDTPRRLRSPALGPEWDGVFDTTVVGGIPGGFSETWSILYWGADRYGVPWLIMHETSPPCLDAFSQSPYGPDPGSLAEVLDALVWLGNDELTGYVNDLGPVKWDYELGEGAAICGKGCLENKKAA